MRYTIRYVLLSFIVVLSLLVLGCDGEEKAGEATFSVAGDGQAHNTQVVVGQPADIRDDDVRVAGSGARIADRDAAVVGQLDPDQLGSGDADVSGETAAGANDASDIPSRPDGSGEDGAEEEPETPDSGDAAAPSN